MQSKHIDLLKPEGIYVPMIITFLLITGDDATDNGDLLNFYLKENCLFNHSVIRSLDDIITATYSYAEDAIVLERDHKQRQATTRRCLDRSTVTRPY